MGEKDHIKEVKKAFSQQAPHFDTPSHSIANREHLLWILDRLTLSAKDNALDVAAGTALLGRAIAPKVERVIALEATESMADQGKAACHEERINNLEYRIGRAESIPFPDNHFDIVVCRLALHHFVDISQCLCEMKRAVKKGGFVSVIDLVSPDDPEIAVAYNEVERLRDPSHVNALAKSGLLSAIESAGLTLVDSHTREIEVDGETWLNFTHCSGERRGGILDRWRAELDGGPATGMEPRLSGSLWKFRQCWVMANSVK